MTEALTRNVFYPLWDWKDRSVKLRRLAELEKSQWLSADDLRRQQWASLNEILDYAATHSPYYRRLFSEVGISRVETVEDFRRIPITTKRHIRTHQRDFISDEFQREGLLCARTGGSTGVSLELRFDKRCEERRNAAAMRSDRWAGWELGIWRGALWGNPPESSVKRWVRNTLLDRIFVLDTMSMSPTSMDAFLAEMDAKGRVVLFGHSHSLFILARYARQVGRSVVSPLGIIATSMMLLQKERALIEEVFRCKVSNRYGCEEVGLIASQCEKHAGLHINVDDVYVEVLREDGSPAALGEPGKIVLTDLGNRGMPLIRYRVEDVGVLGKGVCSCGRKGPILESIAGRIADFLKSPDGTMVAGVSLVERTLTAIRGIEQMQLVQEVLDELSINVVRDSSYSAESEEALLHEMRGVFGSSMRLVINYVEGIAQEPNGKYRFAICRV